MKTLDTYLNLCTEFYDLDKPNAPKDALNFYLAYAKKASGPILEPMCGTGNFLIPFIEEGFDVAGFDASSHMLDLLHEKLKQKNITPNIWLDFLQDLNRIERYSLILIPNASIGLITNLEQVKLSLKKIYDHLQDRGQFVFEIENLKAISSQSNVWSGKVKNRGQDQKIVASFLPLPLEDGISTIICRYDLVEKNTVIKTEIENFQTRPYEPNQMFELLHEAGFKEIKLIKKYEHGREPSENDEEIVFECKKYI